MVADIEKQSTTNDTDMAVTDATGCTNAKESESAVNEDTENEATYQSQSSPPPSRPLFKSSRLKGYITLLVSAIYNFISVNDGYLQVVPSSVNLCLLLDDISRSEKHLDFDEGRVQYANSVSTITIIVAGAVMLIHLDVVTGLDEKLWKKMFGPNGKVELFILVFLILVWFITTWFNTTIRGPAGDGKEQFNLYFSTWICLWTSFWTLERWCTSSGRASFQQFVESWPNRCQMWIVTFFLSIVDFLFVLDSSRHWKDGTRAFPYVSMHYSNVKTAEWTLLLFVTSATFLVSLAWV